jgi:hypothetical protein
MATLNAQNCEQTLLGTGLPECLADLGYPKGFIYTKPNWSENISTTIDKAYILEQIQLGNFYPFVDSFSMEQNTPDPTTEESANGELTVVRNGLPQFTFSFIKTWQFQKIAASYNGFGRFGVIFVFDNDVLLVANNGTTISGFKAGMTNTNTYMFNNGSEQGKTPMSFQLLDNKQFNSQGDILNPDFDVTNEITGVIDCVLSDGAAATGGNVTIKVTAKANPSLNILGLGVDQLSLVIDGVREVATNVSYNDALNVYTLTPTSTTTGEESVIVELYDASIPASVANLSDQLYAGKSDAITVA